MTGDSDLGDSSLQNLYDLYMERRNFYGKLRLGERRGKILTDLAESLKKLEDDMLFLKRVKRNPGKYTIGGLMLEMQVRKVCFH